MRKKLEFLRRDIYRQKALIGIVFISMILPYFLIITLPILGICQLYSGVYLANLLKDRNRYIYLVLSTIWMLVMITFVMLDLTLTVSQAEFWVSLIFIIVPLIMAFSYLKYSIDTLSDLEEYAICQF